MSDVARIRVRSDTVTRKEWSVAVPATPEDIGLVMDQVWASHEWSTEKEASRSDITQPVLDIRDGRITVSYTYRED